MDTELPGPGSYLRRAEALIAARRDLFGAAPRPAVSEAFIAQTRVRAPELSQSSARQLRLPLPRERGRRRARMLR
jgi:hypothetical protein